MSPSPVAGADDAARARATGEAPAGGPAGEPPANTVSGEPPADGASGGPRSGATFADAGARGTAAPVVGIAMGSTSDQPTMAAAAAVLDEFGVPHEMRIMSAHRRPFDMLDYGRDAATRGLRVLIAGAGGAAHLPGMLAAVTTLPVIGVPVPLRQLQGIDSLLSIVQMPRGVPVATVAIGNAHNAALLAVRILAITDARLASQLQAQQQQMTDDVRRADRALLDGTAPADGPH